MKYFFWILLFFTTLIINAKKMSPNLVGATSTPTVHVISIGINNYKSVKLEYSVSDSKLIIEKIKKNDSIIVEDRVTTIKTKVKFNIYSLIDEQASVLEIKRILAEIITKAKHYDYFIFYFGGISYDSIDFEDTLLATCKTNFNDMSNFKDTCLSLSDLSKFLEQVPCKNQLIISEAGDGKNFSQNLIKHLFESNFLLSANTNRNRIIITTKGFGYEIKEINGAPLVYYLNNSNINILDVFRNKEAFDFEIFKSEINKPFKFNKKSRYTSIYSENEYKQILLNSPNISRGSKGTKTNTEDKKKDNHISQTYAIIISTNEYKSNQWNTLKNPINDAESISEILASKYNVITSKVYNKSLNEVLTELIRIKNKMNENDKFIFFIAGHGYYSENLSDGFLVFNNSDNTDVDIGLKSYLSMATLQRLLDNMPSKNVFAIFDVCFGASFDLLSKDLILNDFKNTENDISMDDFIKRKNEKCSRIFLASGRYEVPDYWKNSLKHSPFADKIIKTLDNKKDFISPGILFSALEGNATEPFLKQFGKHEERGDFLLEVTN